MPGKQKRSRKIRDLFTLLSLPLPPGVFRDKVSLSGVWVSLSLCPMSSVIASRLTGNKDYLFNTNLRVSGLSTCIIRLNNGFDVISISVKVSDFFKRHSRLVSFDT